MDKSGILVGGTIGAMIVIAIFAVVFVFPPASMTSVSITSETDAIDDYANSGRKAIRIF